MYIPDFVSKDGEDELVKLWRQFNTIREALKRIKRGDGVAGIHFPGEGLLEMNAIFEDPNYIEKMAADLASYQIVLAQQLSTELQKIVDADTAAVTENVEPYPIGTPKNDHRRLNDTDDGK